MFRSKLWPVCIILLVTSCSSIKNTTIEDPIYKGAELQVTMKQQADKPKIGKLKRDIEGAIRPQKTPSIIREWIYLKINNPEDKKIKGFIKNKIGKPPIYLSKVSPEKNKLSFTKLLKSAGYFKPDISYEIITNKHKSRIYYQIDLPPRYKISAITYPSSEKEITKEINQSQTKSLIKVGEYYDLKLLSEERKRISSILKNKGYYLFKEEFLFFQVDTGSVGNEAALALNLREDLPDGACNKFHISNVIVYPDIRDKNDTISREDTIYYGAYTRIEKSIRIKDKTLFNALLIHKDSLYSSHKHQLSVKRLMNLGVFKNVNIDYKVVDKSGLLDCYVYYHTLEEQTVKADVEITTKSNSFTGPGFELGYRNLNVFKGAENLYVKLNSGFESQFSTTRKGLESFRFGGDIALTIPKLLLPIHLNTFENPKPPETKINLGYQLLNRRDYYTINSFYIHGGYHFFSKNRTQTFELYPISINYTKLANTSLNFETILKENPYYARSFQQQYIIGSLYSYKLVKNSNNSWHNYYLKIDLDNAGNFYGLLAKTFNLNVDETFSQYSIMSIDSRNYIKIEGGKLLAFRFFTGVGIPYGSSEQLPYVKQFYSGGANSIRAFPIRSVGPGNYTNPYSLSSRSFFDQAGDIKLELNLEYRFPIIGYLKGALFTDAGNVWLYKKNEIFPGGEFKITDFYKQLAMGIGAGLRIDVSYFVVRFDAAIPARLASAQTWTFNGSNLGNSEWRKQNLVLNLAIGYPF